MGNDTTAKARPTHRIFSVSKPKGDAKPFWLEIGAAWPHKDGKGFSLQFNACPYGDAEVVIRAAMVRAGGAQ